MKVSSPVGDFPFEPRRVRSGHHSLVVEGSMGAWPARVEVGLGDVPAIVRLVPGLLLATAVGLVVAIVALVLWPARFLARQARTRW
jgi:hypothetical protein